MDSVADLAWAGKQPQAIAAATLARADPATPAVERHALLDLRAESLLAIGDFDAALADAEALQRAAALAGDLPSKARALCRLSLVSVRRGDISGATRSGSTPIRTVPET